MRIDEFKDYVKSLPISQVITQYLPLKKRGANYEAICPFHDDSNPSLKVNDGKGIYKCFVCGEAGDAIRFVSQYKGMTFIDTLKDLSSILQVQLENTERKKRNPKIDIALRILSSTAKIYFSYAQKSQPKAFLDFLKNRELSEKTRETFQLGFAPSNNMIVKYLQTKDQENPETPILQVAQEIGLIKIGKHGHYDTFRSRIIFPIWDQSGEVRGFGSRSITDEQIPKYLNSSESFIFDKKNLSFGLNFAKSIIREKNRIILTEGYMDSIMLNQQGFEEAVAIMGIAITDEKARKLQTFSKNIYLSFDNDKAGEQASHRAHNAFIKQGVLPKKVDLSPHKDPDDFLKNEGKIEFIKRIDEAKAMIDILIRDKLNQKFGDNTDLKISALREIFEILSPLKMDLRAKERVSTAIKYLGISTSKDEVLNSYQQYLSEKKQKVQNQPKRKPVPPIKLDFEGDQVATQEREQSQNLEQARNVPIRKFQNSKTDQLIIKSLFEFFPITKETEFTEILNFATNSDTHNFVKSWIDNFEEKSDEVQRRNLMSKIFEDVSYSEEFKKFVYSCVFSISDAKESNHDRLLKALKKRIFKKFLALKKQQLISKRARLTEKEEIEFIDQEINKLISQYKDTI